MDLTREEIFAILQGMRVDLPADTKLPFSALEARLTRAIERSQPSQKSKDINPSTLKRWDEVSNMKLVHVMGSLSEGERVKIDDKPEGPMSALSVLLSPFTYLRALMGWLGASCDSGARTIIVHDKNWYCIPLRVVDVFAFSNDMPIVVVKYEHGPASPDVLEARENGRAPSRIPTTNITQKILLKILEMNSKRLLPSYVPPFHADEGRKNISRSQKSKALVRPSATSPEPTSDKGTLSFLLPILPLSMREVGGLSSDAGCAVCGQPTVSRCAACQYVAYCSKSCQKADWATSHKSECKKRALSSGTWVNVDISDPGYPSEEYTRPINEFSPATDATIGLKKKEELVVKSAKDWPPPNIHGDNPFVVKVTAPGSDMGSGFRPLLVYDRRRSVEFFLSVEADLVSYEALLRTTREKGQHYKIDSRIFLFAKRTGRTTLSVCLDREPPAESVKW